MSSSSTGSYKIAFSPDLSGFSSVGATISKTLSGALNASSGIMGGVSNGLGSISSGLDGIASKIKTGVLAGLAATGFSMSSYMSDAIKASDATDSFINTLKFAGVATNEIDELTKNTRKYADLTVYSLGDIQSITSQLTANGVKGAEGIAEAAGNLNAVAGGTADTYRSVGLVITQTQGLGKLNTGNWNQLANAIPGAAGKLKDALKDAGAYTGNFSDALTKGEISSDEFQQAIVKLGSTAQAQMAATSTSTFSGAWGNLEATIVGGLQDALDINKAGLTGLINQLNGPATAATKYFSDGLTVITQVLTGQKSIMDVIGSMWQTGFTNANTALTTLKTDADNALGGILPIIKSVISGTTSWKDAIGQIGVIIQKTVSAGDLGTILIGLGAGIPILAKVTGALSGLTGIMSTVLGAGGNVVSAITGGIGNVGSAIGGLLGKGSGLTSMLSGLKSIMNPWVLLIGAVVAGLVIFLTQTDQGRSMLGQLWTVLQQMWTALQPAITMLMASLQQLWAALQPALAQLLPALQPIFAALTQIIIDLLPVLTPILQVILTVITAIVQILTAMMPGITAVLNIVIGIIAGIMQYLSFGIGIITKTWMPVINALATAWRAVFGDIVNILTGFITFFKDIFTGNFSAVGKDIANILGNIGQLFSDWVGGFVNIGGNILKGIWNGISSGWGWIKGKLSGFVDSFMDFIKGLFGIHSPSKLMASQVGIWLPRGIGEGIDDGSDELLDQARDFSSDLSTALTATASVNAGTVNGVATAAGTGVDYGSAGTAGHPQVVINQEVSKADGLMDIYLQTKKAANGYFARGIVPVDTA